MPSTASRHCCSRTPASALSVMIYCSCSASPGSRWALRRGCSGGTSDLAVAMLISGGFGGEGGLDPHWRHRKPRQADAGGIVDGIGDHRAHHDDGGFASTLGRQLVVLEDDALDLRHPGEAWQLVGAEVGIQHLATLEMDFFGEGVT